MTISSPVPGPPNQNPSPPNRTSPVQQFLLAPSTGGAMAIVSTKRGRGDLPTSSEAAAEYPCVRRLRHRRLLTFLSLQNFDAALRSAAGETEAFFSVPRLRGFVERGQWKGAVEYLLRFLPPGGLRVLGLEAQVLRRFLVAHMALARILAGTEEGDVLAEKYGSKYRDHGSSVCHGIVRLRSIMLTALHAKRQLRESLDWECVWRKASEIVEDLAYRTPELKDVVLKLKPSGPMEPHNLIPIGFSSRHRCPYKKPSRCARASSLAKGYLQRKRSLLPSSHSQESHDELLNKAMNCVADAVEESLKAGKRLQLNQDCPLKPSGREGASATVAPIPQTMFGTFPGATKITGMPIMANADKLSRHVLSSSASLSGMMFGSPVLLTASGFLTAPAKNYGISLLTNAGATVTPVPRTIFGTMPGPARSPGIPSVANSGKFASHVPSCVVPVPTVFGCLTNPDKSSGVSLMTDAGTNTCSSQEVYSAESGHQSIVRRKNTREEELSTDEQDLPPKLQQTTGAFSEASVAEYLL